MAIPLTSSNYARALSAALAGPASRPDAQKAYLQLQRKRAAQIKQISKSLDNTIVNENTQPLDTDTSGTVASALSGGMNYNPASAKAVLPPKEDTIPSTGASPIPGADIYMGAQNEALAAWNRSKTALAQQQGQIWQKAGMRGNFNPDTGETSNVDIDPMSQYGDRQRMAQQHGAQLDANDENAYGRGFFGAGIGQQANSLARYMQGGQRLDFGRGLLNQFQNVYQGYGNASSTYNNAVTNAQYQRALAAALAKNYTTAPAPGSPNDPTEPTTPADPTNTLTLPTDYRAGNENVPASIAGAQTGMPSFAPADPVGKNANMAAVKLALGNRYATPPPAPKKLPATNIKDLALALVRR